MKGCINITDGEISLFSIQPRVCDFKIGAQRRMHWERERSDFSGAHDHLSTVILWLEQNPTVKGKNSTMHSAKPKEERHLWKNYKLFHQ